MMSMTVLGGGFMMAAHCTQAASVTVCRSAAGERVKR